MAASATAHTLGWRDRPMGLRWRGCPMGLRWRGCPMGLRWRGCPVEPGGGARPRGDPGHRAALAAESVP
jgi:hypothetical protein